MRFDTHLTPYADVNVVLHELLSGVQTILGNHFIGLYLYGSLALGDFDPERSDIDFLVVTTDDLPAELISALKPMHARMAAGSSKWATELEGSYIPQAALRRYDPNRARHPRINRGEGTLGLEQHDCDWVIQRHVLREHGVVLAGPTPQTLIDPILPHELRQAVLETLHGWWASRLTDPTQLRIFGYRAYAILTMCRILYTLKYGSIISKPVAARWAQQTLDERWASLIERALTWRYNIPSFDVDETLDFIRYTLKRSQPFSKL